MPKNNPVIVFPRRRHAELQYREIPVPKPGELLIRNSRSLVSIGTEMTAFCGDYPAGSVWEKSFPYPFDAGYAAVGEVVDVGEGVDKLWIGRRVGSTAPHCRYASKHQGDIRPIRRDEVSCEEATFYIIAQIVMRGIRMSKVGWGSAVAVYGLGLLGQFAARFCRLCGARPVFAIDVSAFRLGMLPDNKAFIKLNPKECDVKAAIRKGTSGRMCDIAFEVTGEASLIPGEFDSLHRQGCFVVMSSPRDKTLFDFHDLCNCPSHTIIGAHNYSHPEHPTLENPWTMERHSELFFDLVADGELDVKRMISHRVNWRQAPEIYGRLLEDRSQYMGIVFDWEGAEG